jgi:hypothetical protein
VVKESEKIVILNFFANFCADFKLLLAANEILYPFLSKASAIEYEILPAPINAISVFFVSN